MEEKAKYMLREFGCIERRQFSMLLPKSKKVLVRLFRRRVFYSLYDNQYVGIAPKQKPDDRMREAIEIMLAFREKMDDMSYHSSQNYPFQLFFLKNHTPYWIMVIHNEEQYRLHESACKELDDDETLIVGFTQKKDLKFLPELNCRVVGAFIDGNRVRFYERMNT